jgi:hypothetical protein
MSSPSSAYGGRGGEGRGKGTLFGSKRKRCAALEVRRGATGCWRRPSPCGSPQPPPLPPTRAAARSRVATHRPPAGPPPRLQLRLGGRLALESERYEGVARWGLSAGGPWPFPHSSPPIPKPRSTFVVATPLQRSSCCRAQPPVDGKPRSLRPVPCRGPPHIRKPHTPSNKTGARREGPPEKDPLQAPGKRNTHEPHLGHARLVVGHGQELVDREVPLLQVHPSP